MELAYEPWNDDPLCTIISYGTYSTLAYVVQPTYAPADYIGDCLITHSYSYLSLYACYQIN